MAMSFKCGQFREMNKNYFKNTYLNTFSETIDLSQSDTKIFIKQIDAALNSKDGASKFIQLVFKNGGGRWVSAWFYCKEKTNGIDVFWTSMNVKFTLAPDKTVIRYSKSNFFKTRDWEEVHYTPNNITRDEIYLFFGMQSYFFTKEALSN